MAESIVNDDFTEELQERIIQNLRDMYSPMIMDHWQNPRNWGIMNVANGYAKITGPCGDTMEMSLKVEDKMIVKCTFDTDGCGTSIACASVVTEMVKDRTIKEARKIRQDRVLRHCGGLPEADQHCALLAANTLQKAIDDYESTKKEPWRELYRRM